jgi:hypothetical protein
VSLICRLILFWTRTCAHPTIRERSTLCTFVYHQRCYALPRYCLSCKPIEEGTLGQGSIAGDEYLEDMEHGRFGSDGAVTWVEVCSCATPLAEERFYWEKYFDLLSVTDAHGRNNCRDLNGTEPWACCNCDCTSQLEERLARKGEAFLERLRSFRSDENALLLLNFKSCRFILGVDVNLYRPAKQDPFCDS